jgi:hypothetical protein
MSLETATYIDGLVATNPVSTDPLQQADDHMRLIKSTIKATFPNITGAITADQAEINVLDGITASTTELNLLTGTTALTADLDYAAALNATGVTTAEFGYLSGATSNIQTQIDNISTELVNDTSPQLGGALDTNGQSIQFGSWTISIDGSNNLSFAYGGDVKLRITSAGALDVEDDITAYAGI